MSQNDICLHRVQYYETDRMGIVHHSNYIRWMEEGRTEVMRLRGVDYARIEATGILMPVVSVSCDYKHPARFGDAAEIEVKIERFTGVRLEFRYRICLQGTGLLLAEGKSVHCFIDEQTRKPLNLSKRLPLESRTMFLLAEEAKGAEE
jgi:acyl-CoA thioester hydrolase